MYRFILLVLFFPLCTLAEDVSIKGSASTEKICEHDLCFPTATLVGEQIVPIRNVKKKKYFLFNLYVAALYLGKEMEGVSGVLSDTPKKIVFRYLRDFKRDDLVNAADKVMGKNPETDLLALESRMGVINEGYSNGIKEGEVYELEYDPKRGSTLIRNGKEFCTIPGLDFAKAYFGIWLSNYPMSEDLRDSLLKHRT